MTHFLLLISLSFVALAVVTGNPFFMIGAFLFLVRAARETQTVRAEITLHEETVEEAMMVVFLTLSSGDSLRQASSALVKAPGQCQFPVMQGDSPVGLVTRDALMKGMTDLGDAVYVAEVMERSPVTVKGTENLRGVLVRVPDLRRTPALVLEEQGHLAGILTAESVAHYLALRSLRRQRRIRQR